jgi:hypothetical protein
LLDETVAMNSDRRSIFVGMTDKGCSASLCCDAVLAALSIIPVLFPRGNAVVELRRISNVLRLLLNPFLVTATNRKVGPLNRG